MKACAEFVHYGNMSVRVDRYYHTALIFARHHASLRGMYEALPQNTVIKGISAPNGTPEDWAEFLAVARSGLGWLANTGIFAKEQFDIGGSAEADLALFAFYTCYTSQWALFEGVLHILLDKAIDVGQFSEDQVKAINKNRYPVKRLMDTLHGGQILPSSPFEGGIPVIGTGTEFEPFEFSDVDRIRRTRNEIIHDFISQEAQDVTLKDRSSRYIKDMWILRKCAENVMFHCNCMDAD